MAQSGVGARVAFIWLRSDLMLFIPARWPACYASRTAHPGRRATARVEKSDERSEPLLAQRRARCRQQKLRDASQRLVCAGTPYRGFRRELRCLAPGPSGLVAQPLAVPAYTVDQILRQFICRSTALDLHVTGDTHETADRIINLV